MLNVYRAVEDALHAQEEEEKWLESSSALPHSLAGKKGKQIGLRGLTGRNRMEPVPGGVHLGTAGLDREPCIGRESSWRKAQRHLCKMRELRAGLVKIWWARHDGWTVLELPRPITRVEEVSMSPGQTRAGRGSL